MSANAAGRKRPRQVQLCNDTACTLLELTGGTHKNVCIKPQDSTVRYIPPAEGMPSGIVELHKKLDASHTHKLRINESEFDHWVTKHASFKERQQFAALDDKHTRLFQFQWRYMLTSNDRQNVARLLERDREATRRRSSAAMEAAADVRRSAQVFKNAGVTGLPGCGEAKSKVALHSTKCAFSDNTTCFLFVCAFT